MVYQYPQLWFTLLSVTPSIFDGRKEKGNNRIAYYQIDFKNDKYLSFLPALVSDGKSSESNITVRLYIFCLQSPAKKALGKMRFHVFLTCATTLFVAVLSSPVAETDMEYRLGYKEKCASDGSLGWCMAGYYCKVHHKITC